MPVTLVTGKLGGGKTLVCVGKIRDALLEGRRVATNLDLNLEFLLPAKCRRLVCQRLPDKPAVSDLDLLGIGNESMDESKNGLIVLDELGTWLNSRQWGDKSRQAVIDWLLHSRKKGWDVIFISQHQNLIDKQVREAVIEFLVTCRRLDRLPIPFVGWIIRSLSGGLLTGRMPRIHVGIVRYGMAIDSLVVERWIYRGVELYRAYNTRQVFSDTYLETELKPGPGVVGTFSYLTPWHLVGRFKVPFLELVRRWWTGYDRLQRLKARPGARVAPLLRLPPEARWRMARQLVERGVL
jgi:hypothetical protein